MPWRKHNKLTQNDTAGIVLQQHSQYSRLYTSKYLFFMKRLFCVCRRSVLFIPWFLTEGEVEVLVDPSTWANLNKVEPGTNDRDCLSSLIVLQSYVQILLFVHRLVCKGHFRIKNVPSLYSQFRLDVLVSWEYFRINLPWPYILDAACKYLHSSFDVSMSCKQL